MKIINDSIIEDFGDFWKNEMLPGIRKLNSVLYSNLDFETQKASVSSWPNYRSPNPQNLEVAVVDEKDEEDDEPESMASRVIFTQKEYPLKSESFRESTSRPVFPTESLTTESLDFEDDIRSVEESPRIPETNPPLVAQPMDSYDSVEELTRQKSEDYAPYGVD